MARNEIKACPLCGGRAALGYDHGSLHPYTDKRGSAAMTPVLYTVHCTECMTSTASFEDSQMAIERWNTRPDTVAVGSWQGGDSDGYADGYPVFDTLICSCCGLEIEADDESAYCPGCGARMVNDE